MNGVMPISERGVGSQLQVGDQFTQDHPRAVLRSDKTGVPAERSQPRRVRRRAVAAYRVAEDGAAVIVLAGAPLAGLARQVHGLLPVPVVDGVSSAVRHAETLVALAPTKARAGSLAPPPGKPNAGLSPQLQALLAGH